MKKKLMIGLIAGTAVFAAVFGAAATLGTTTSQTLGAGGADVTSCDTTGVGTSYSVAYDATSAAYKVDKVTVTGIADACAGKDITVTLTNASDAALTSQSATGIVLSGATADAKTYELTLSTPQAASVVEGVHVLIKG